MDARRATATFAEGMTGISQYYLFSKVWYLKSNYFVMRSNTQLIPLSIAKLIVAFFNETLAPEEQNDLDAWVSVSEENLIVFEEMVELVEKRSETRLMYSLN